MGTDENGNYDGAGDGQCIALTGSGEQCTNGTYGSDDLCGVHKRTDDVQTVVEATRDASCSGGGDGGE